MTPLFLDRRTWLRFGAAALAGRNVRAQSRVTPRGNADAVIFLNLQGGPSQMDMFDLKHGAWAPENRGVAKTPFGYEYPYGLMPKLSGQLKHLAVVRSAQAWETVHSRGQYYLQTGHAVSAARIKESPSIGSVVAHEYRDRAGTDDFLPPFVAMNYEPTTMYGPLQTEGCLPADCAPLTLDLAARNLPFFVEEKERERLRRRWEALRAMDGSRAALDDGSPAVLRRFANFSERAWKMMNHPQMAGVMRITEDEHQAYGGTAFGDACLIARNMVAAKAGARFLLVTQPGWDHHSSIYGKDGKGGLYKTCSTLDAAFAALLADLERMKLLERTLVVCMGEFGRTPGGLTPVAGREHYADTMFALFAGAGVKGGRVMGATDAEANKITEFGWSGRRPVYPEDVCATIYSALGIDWSKRITGTPSGRDFLYVDPAAGTRVVNFKEVADLYA